MNQLICQLVLQTQWCSGKLKVPRLFFIEDIGDIERLPVG